jgi:Ni,Fe-hydrogenase III small subunit
MIRLLRKTVATPSPLISIDPSACERVDINVVGREIEDHVKRLFRGSLAIRQVDAGSDNAAEQELVALSNPFYDVERFGVHFVASPRHADMLMATGPVARNMAEALRRTYAATPDPKFVVALGDDAIDGGIFRGSYAVYDAVKNVIPVDYEIAGDPPSPRAILCALLKILETIRADSLN